MGWYCLIGVLLTVFAGVVGYCVGRQHSDQEINDLYAVIHRNTSTERTRHDD